METGPGGAGRKTSQRPWPGCDPAEEALHLLPAPSTRQLHRLRDPRGSPIVIPAPRLLSTYVAFLCKGGSGCSTCIHEYQDHQPSALAPYSLKIWILWNLYPSNISLLLHISINYRLNISLSFYRFVVLPTGATSFKFGSGFI